MRRVVRVVGLLVAVAGLVFGAVAYAGSRDGSTEGTGALRSLTPTVTVVGEGGEERPGSGPVAEGERVRTDAEGVGRLDWFDGSVTRIGPGSELTVTRLRDDQGVRKIAVSLDVGKTWHRVVSASGEGSSYEATSANAVAAVRGTSFGLACSAPTSCVVAVAEGVVEVTSHDGQTRSVTAGKQVGIEGDHVGPLEPLQPDQFLQDAVEADARDGVRPPEAFPTTTSTLAPSTTIDRGTTIRIGPSSG